MQLPLSVCNGIFTDQAILSIVGSTFPHRTEAALRVREHQKYDDFKAVKISEILLSGLRCLITVILRLIRYSKFAEESI